MYSESSRWKEHEHMEMLMYYYESIGPEVQAHVIYTTKHNYNWKEKKCKRST